MGEIFAIQIPKRHEKKLRPIIEELRSLYQTIAEINGAPDISYVRKSSATFVKVQKDLLLVQNDISADRRMAKELRDAALYHVMMERALCSFWLAAFAKSLRISQEKSDGGLGALDHIRNALSTYQEVCLLDDFVHDPVLAFRIACTLELKGDYELSLSKFREAASLLKNWDASLPDEYFRVRIPLQYGVSLWQAAEGVRRRASELGGLTFTNSHRQDLYLEAIQVTLPLVEMDMSGMSQDAPSTPQEQKLNAYNNVLDYSIAFLKCGGRQEKLDSIGVNEDFLRNCLDEIVAGGVDSISHATIADTVREAAKFFGDGELKERAAERVKSLIENKDFSYTLPDIAYSEMKLDAERDLE